MPDDPSPNFFIPSTDHLPADEKVVAMVWTNPLCAPIRMQRGRKVLDQECDTVIGRSWIPSSSLRDLHFMEQQRFVQEMNCLDCVPVMSATVLGLEMLLCEPSIDLQKVSQLVLSDVGATIKILRLIGREYAFAAERPSRMGDCISGLDVGIWFDAISARTFSCNGENALATALWRHCRLVAQYAQLVAESTEGAVAEDAYLVGLLHGIGAIPMALGWLNGGSGASFPSALHSIEEVLPLFVLEAMQSVKHASSLSPWKSILVAAHELAGTRAHCDPFTLRAIDSRGSTSRCQRLLPDISEYIPCALEPLGLNA